MDFETEDKLATLRALVRSMDDHLYAIANKQHVSRDRKLDMDRLAAHIQRQVDSLSWTPAR